MQRITTFDSSTPSPCKDDAEVDKAQMVAPILVWPSNLELKSALLEQMPQLDLVLLSDETMTPREGIKFEKSDGASGCPDKSDSFLK